MADIQPPESQINGNGGGGGVGGSGVGGQLVMGSSETVGSKRQRRPSVRLGDIGGDQPYDSHVRSRTNKQWKLHLDQPHHHRTGKDSTVKTSKTRPLINFSSSASVAGSGSDLHDTLEADDREREANLETMAIGSWKLKDSKKRGSLVTKRFRSNWVSSKLDEDGGGGGGAGDGDEKYSAGEDVDDGYRDFEVENSESPLKEQSPIHSLENLAVDGHGNEREVLYHGNRRPIRARVSEARDHHDGVELSGPSDTDARDWKCGGTSGDRNGNGGRGRCGEDGVRVWLNGLGLGRYAPVFEIHEVDDEVLPMLTLEDLKDMGINAVGSRRKMYCAIQKLGKGFS
ncbi:uncharacterized protein LOC125422255 [Ziziphus jujuba]|uniref:Uncharacterized protein LOC125422255 n=2 Tax=Ziziphus jujuba TaxID=326968 RepID=A0ABM3II60_ZIZJJ|nr:uncharacterized protein LOC125422255 [Ziziphus jujuba]KAH7528169.1 hypothetical protein FEM48_Zijuj05G0043500 [Ziziphus jujuba var. spinosa]